MPLEFHVSPPVDDQRLSDLHRRAFGSDSTSLMSWSTRLHRHSIGKKLIEIAAAETRARGCEWLHVDFEESLAGFYLGGCGFRTTAAGLLRLDPEVR